MRDPYLPQYTHAAKVAGPCAVQICQTVSQVSREKAADSRMHVTSCRSCECDCAEYVRPTFALAHQTHCVYII